MNATNDFVDIRYQQNGQSTNTDSLGMREMQAKAYEARNKKYLLIKAPPASGKSRALMFIALDKLANQGIRKVVVAVPEKSIGRSFADTNLVNNGFFKNWHVSQMYNLCDAESNEADKAGRFVQFFRKSEDKILLCAHATLRNGMKQLNDEEFNDCLLAIDEFHHTSADADSGLGDIVRRVMNNSTGHIVAMTGSYFRGDGVPVLRVEDEARGLTTFGHVNKSGVLCLATFFHQLHPFFLPFPQRRRHIGQSPTQASLPAAGYKTGSSFFLPKGAPPSV